MTRKQALTLFALQLGLLPAAVDQTVIATAMPAIAQALDGLNRYALATSGYLLASTIMLPLGGKASDVLGRKLVLCLGLFVFALASLGCGFAGQIPIMDGMTQLILFRCLQGLSCGAILACIFAVTADLFDPAERGKYQGIFAAVFCVCALVGPQLGGWITQEFGWRWIFFINVPIVLPACLLVLMVVPGKQVVITHTETTTQNWIHNQTIIISLISTFVTGIGMYGSLLLIPYIFQVMQLQSPLQSANQMSIVIFTCALASIGGGYLLAKTKKYKSLAVLGFLLMMVATKSLAESSEHTMLLWLVLGGVGLGLLLPIYTIVIQNIVPDTTLGLATGLSQFSRSLGGALGTAAFGELLAVLSAREPQTTAIATIFYCYAIVLACALVLNLCFLKEYRLEAK